MRTFTRCSTDGVDGNIQLNLYVATKENDTSKKLSRWFNVT